MSQNSILYKRQIQVSNGIVITIGFLALSGWAFDISVFKSIIPDYSSMKFNTALSFVLISTSIYLQFFDSNKKRILLWKVIGLVVLVISTLTLFQAVFNFDFKIDQLFYTDLDGIRKQNPYPGRMSSATALCFGLMGLFSLSMGSKNKTVQALLQILLHIVTLTSFIAIVGYLLGVPSFYKLSFITSMAIHTSFCFILISLSSSLIHPTIGLTGLFTGTRIGNIMARKLFIQIVFVVLVLAYIRVITVRFETVSVEFGIALFAMSFILTSLFLIWRTAKAVNLIDHQKEQFETGLSQMNTILDSTPDPMIVIDEKGTILISNKQLEFVFGYTKNQIIGQKAEMLIPDRYKGKHEKLRDNFFKSLQTRAMGSGQDLFAVKKNGDELSVEISLSPIELGGKTWVSAAIRDVSERKQKEEKLRISEESFRGNFENAAIGMALLDESGKWLKVNTKVSEIVGYTQKELLELTFPDITHPDDLNTDLGLLNELIEGKRDHYQMEKRYFHKDGHIVYILLAVSVVKNKEGNVLYFISQIIDISESKKLLSDIDYQRELLSALFNLSPIGIALNEYETGKFIDVNDKLLEPTGYNKEEFLALSYWDTTPKEYEPLEAAALQQMESNGSYDLFEKEYIRKDGSRYPIALQGVVIKDSNGKKLIWSFVRDISQEKEHERKLQEAISSLEGILDASKQVSIIATDKEGTITLFNSGAEQLLGYKAEELVGKHNPGLIHLDEEVERESKELSEKYNKEIKGFETFIYGAKVGVPSTKEWTYIRKNGTHVPVLLSINTIADNENIVGYLGVATDISELKKVEREIKSLLDITNEQNERLRNFAHIVSHNLRSHSAGISGILDLIQMDQPDILKNEFFEHLNKGAENLSQTVHDLTEIVKVHFNKSDVSDVHIREVIQKNTESLSIKTKKARFKIINNIDKDLVVKGVPAYLDSIVLNMITNAIKYRSEERSGYLKIHANVEESMISISFEDNGLGIDLKKHGDKLFGMYKTFHNHDDSRGVGLFITKNQIESMGGKIDVESEVNVGTTFIIALPK